MKPVMHANSGVFSKVCRSIMPSIVFGPIPSRRLGYSLGVNNIPPKICSYSCVYCQLGRTDRLRVDRAPVYSPESICSEVQKRIETAIERGLKIDYVTVVPDGEPTLDVNLGRTIKGLREFGIKIAVITNASLIWCEDVRDDLAKADWISLKIDAVDVDSWRRLNRPHSKLRLNNILQGMNEFSRNFTGELTTETMVIAGLNDSERHAKKISYVVTSLNPKIAYISVPTRPPADVDVKAPEESNLAHVFHIFQENVERVELLTGYEGNAFAYTGDVEADILSITTVHPMREDAVVSLLKKSGGEWSLVQRLVKNGQLIEIPYNGNNYYLRKLRMRY
jgi:wyosine [tRNA(Phe)-imidazoG37] synthetase (radical SAM superfamily)